MARIFGIGVGLVWAGFAFYAFQQSSAGWAQGHTDIGFWWAVIGAFLAIASVGAVVGTLIHTRPRA